MENLSVSKFRRHFPMECVPSVNYISNSNISDEIHPVKNIPSIITIFLLVIVSLGEINYINEICHVLSNYKFFIKKI